MTKCKCQSTNNQMQFFATNITSAQIGSDIIDGVEYVVVPVVMAIANVEMNGGYISPGELFPQSWNGEPVTLGHPVTPDGSFLSASTKEAIESYAVGFLLNVKVDGDKLKAEAFINLEKLEALDAEVVNMLFDENNQMDVSTGYYAEHVDGENGLKSHINIKPDHLALLPYEEGACNFNDGCGVRANTKSQIKSKANFMTKMFSTQRQKDAGALSELMGEEITPAKNARADNDDHMQMAVDLFSSDNSPFRADKDFDLIYLSKDTLKALRDHFLKDKKDQEETANSSEPKTGDEEKETDEATINQRGEEMTEETTPTGLSDAQQKLLADAGQIVNARKTDLKAKILANSNFEESELDNFELNQLEKLAGSLKPAVNHSVKNGFARELDSNAYAKEIEAMTGGNENV